MKNVFLYAHGGSGNHGCEAIVRSTAKILKSDKIHLLSARPEEDNFYGLDKICHIYKDQNPKPPKNNFDFLRAYTALKIKKDFVPMDKLMYKKAFSNIGIGDVALSIGGDNYCYADVNKYIMLHDIVKAQGAKTVLWGCSVEPSVAARPDVAADLARYDLITARETITYEALKAINPNTRLVADPAFVLDAVECELPNGFAAGNTVGINLSPMAIDLESVPGIAFENYKHLISHIIESTDMQVALIPHVVWNGGDDRIPLRRLYDEFSHTGRVIMIEDCECRKLKYIISKCRFFIGARTHATIAAYSSCVPTLVLGYSVKSRGIARDIFGTENGYVIPVQSIEDKSAITNAFIRLYSNESGILHHLQDTIPSYSERIYQALDLL